MSLRHRPMLPNDVRKCVEMIAANPVLRPRYGPSIAQLHETWLKLLGSAAFTAVVFEESLEHSCRMVGVGTSAFISDAFAQEIKTPPLFWIGPEMARRVCAGDSPLPSDKQVREANARGGLNLFGWHGIPAVEFGKRTDVLNFIFSTFVEIHRGFLVKELFGQADSAEMAQAMSNIGGCFWDQGLQRFVTAPPCSLEGVASTPHLMGLTRELAFAGPGQWITSLFLYQAPGFGFRPSEQRLLGAALRGITDEELSDELGISLSTVRRTWLSIYDRVIATTPELFIEEFRENCRTSARGKGKKFRLLAYLRDHPEELRPVARSPRDRKTSARAREGVPRRNLRSI